MTLEELESMSQRPIETIPKSSLINIGDVTVDTSLPSSECLLKYLEQIGNPYSFLCGDTPVHISFVNDKQELSEILVGHFQTYRRLHG